MKEQERFNELMEELFNDKFAFIIYFTSLLYIEGESIETAKEKLEQLNMLESFLKEKTEVYNKWSNMITNFKTILSEFLSENK